VGHFPEDLAHDAFKTAEELGVHYVAWAGGEPLMPHAKDLVLGVTNEHNNVATIVCTNADYLDGYVADNIAGNRNMVTFLSVDDFQELNDKRRGRNSFRNITRGMRNLHERSTLFGYSTTLTSENHDEVSSREFVEDMIDRGSMIGTYLTYISRGSDNLQTDPSQMAYAIGRLNELSRTEPIYFLTTDFGRLSGKDLKRGKRMLALDLGIDGSVRTERGGDVVGHIDGSTELQDVIKSEAVQRRFRRKICGSEDAPEDGKRRDLRDSVCNIVNGSMEDNNLLENVHAFRISSVQPFKKEPYCDDEGCERERQGDRYVKIEKCGGRE
jgi:MoaA/NifB/PqqE/SkfB family radical SAM enzyme